MTIKKQALLSVMLVFIASLIALALPSKADTLIRSDGTQIELPDGVQIVVSLPQGFDDKEHPLFEAFLLLSKARSLPDFDRNEWYRKFVLEELGTDPDVLDDYGQCTGLPESSLVGFERLVIVKEDGTIDDSNPCTFYEGGEGARPAVVFKSRFEKLVCAFRGEGCGG